MKKVVNKYYSIFSVCFLILSLLILLYNLSSQIFNTAIYIVLVNAILLLIVKYKKILFKCLKKRYIRYIIIIIPVLVRVGLLFLHYPLPISDEGTFYNTASAISLGNIFNQKYIATFPYLYSYITVLSLIFKIIGISRNSVIILNIILDIVGSFFAYKTMNLLYSKKVAYITLLVWLYSPLNIIWCSKCLPIIIVNTSFVISIYFLFKLLNNFNNTYKHIVFSILLGIVLGITNSFRPIMIIFIITIILYYIYLFFKKEKIYKLVISLILILIPYKLVGNINSKLVEEYTGYQIDKNSSGWTIYVGSNYNSFGEWFFEPEFNEQINSKEFTPNNLHHYFLDKGISNYKKNGLKNINLLYQKGKILSGMTNLYTYNQFVSSNSKNIISIGLKIYTNLYWFLMISIICMFSYIKVKQEDKTMLIFIILVLGLFSSSLLVEVSPRYFMPVLVPLTLITGYYTFEILNNNYLLGGKR